MDQVNGEMKWELYEMFQALLQAPRYHLAIEGLLLMLILWLLLRKSYNPRDKSRLTQKEMDQLIEEWVPEPLVPEVDENHPALRPRVVTGRPGKMVTVDGIECINVATHNYLGMIDSPQVEEIAIQSVKKYGVGSCGPRGFYGTVDVHLNLEERIAKFMNVEEAVLYSYGFATIASAIPAYAKRGDVIFVDECVCFAIQQGLNASRSDIKYFKHNDTEDLERLLKLQEQEDIKKPRKAKVTRRFLVVEGLYYNVGDICPLPRLVELKNKYKVRLFLEESVSFGVLGETGRGVTEHFGISIDEADNIAASLEHSIGSNGGFSCGTSYIVDHQRLSGLGYCFSAALPPMLAAAAIVALDILENDPSLVTKLRTNCILAHAELQKIAQLRVGGSEVSPIKHVYLSRECKSREEDKEYLEKIVAYAQDKGVAFTLARYVEREEHKLPPASIRVTINSALTEDEIKSVIAVMQDACDAVL